MPEDKSKLDHAIGGEAVTSSSGMPSKDTNIVLQMDRKGSDVIGDMRTEYNPARDREGARKLIAGLLLCMFFMEIFGIFILYVLGKPEYAKEFSGLVLGVTAGLVGSAIGFYYSSKT